MQATTPLVHKIITNDDLGIINGYKETETCKKVIYLLNEKKESGTYHFFEGYGPLLSIQESRTRYHNDLKIECNLRVSYQYKNSCSITHLSMKVRIEISQIFSKSFFSWCNLDTTLLKNKGILERYLYQWNKELDNHIEAIVNKNVAFICKFFDEIKEKETSFFYDSKGVITSVTYGCYPTQSFFTLQKEISQNNHYLKFRNIENPVTEYHEVTNETILRYVIISKTIKVCSKQLDLFIPLKRVSIDQNP